MKTKLITLALLFLSICSFAQTPKLTIKSEKDNYTITLPLPSTTKYSFDDQGTLEVIGDNCYFTIYSISQINEKKLTGANYKELFKTNYAADAASSLKNGLYVIDFYDESGDIQYSRFIYMLNENLFLTCSDLDKSDEIMAMYKQITIVKD